MMTVNRMFFGWGGEERESFAVFMEYTLSWINKNIPPENIISICEQSVNFESRIVSVWYKE